MVSASSDGLLAHSGKVLVKGIGASSVTIVDGVITTTGGIVLPAGAISSAMLAANAAQQTLSTYSIASVFSTAVTGSAVLTNAVTPSLACGGNLIRVEMSGSWSHSAAGVATAYFGLALDGVNVGTPVQMSIPATGIGFWSVVVYTQPAAGNHTFGILVYNQTVGTLTLVNVQQVLVTEQKR